MADKNKANREYKSSLFNCIFSQKEYALQLYNALNDSDYDNPEDVEITTLENVVFINIYNAYFWPLLVTNHEEMRTVQIGISFLVTGDAINYGRVLAGAIICAVVPMVLFLFAQDHIIKGMSAGAVKG